MKKLKSHFILISGAAISGIAVSLFLNPNKINGICGRLLCCLKYEDECYKEYSKNLPKLGKKIETEFGEGKVISVDILKQKYRVDVKDHGIVEVDINEGN